MGSVFRDEIWSTVVRISLASIWLYASVFGKLLNPGFLDPNSDEFVGLTIQYLSQGSIIRNFLYAVAFPHPIITGIIVMVGEMIFGLTMLLGLGVKLSAVTGFYTNLIYFLSASWTGAEEYGLNLLMMILNLYFLLNNPGRYSLDNLLSQDVMSNTKIWVATGSIIYLGVILSLLIYGL
ncbi:TQO small subunit DoxD [Sulfolobus acidocaldarius SUSAZ]|nr:TQO small subunit DoxD [Sulfolobus acidocaldarius SUSAZ]